MVDYNKFILTMASLPTVQNDSNARWYFHTKENQEQGCDEYLNKVFNQLGVGKITTYQIDVWTYSAKKTSSTTIIQQNTKTNTIRNIFSKTATITSKYHHQSSKSSILSPILETTPSTTKSAVKKDNDNISIDRNNVNVNVDPSQSQPLPLWAFVNEKNVLIQLDSKYQTFLNELSLNTAQNHQCNGYNYCVFKRTSDVAEQTNVKTQNVRDLFKVLKVSEDNDKVTIDAMAGIEMAKELFFQSVDKSKYEIVSVEEVKHHDQELYYFTKYKKYKEIFQGESFERWLFHGTDSNLLKQIEANGFDRNFNKTSLFGKVGFCCFFALFCFCFCLFFEIL